MILNPGPAKPCPQWLDRIPKDAKRKALAAENAAKDDVNRCASQAAIGDPELQHWHRLLFQELVPLPCYAGNYRQVDPANPCLYGDAFIGGIKGTSPERVLFTMRQLSRTIDDAIVRLERDYPRLSPDDRAFELAALTAAIIGKFIRIHPFVNGNGRTSRLIWMWFMIRFGFPVEMRISPRPDAPYEELMTQAMNGIDGPLGGHILRHIAKQPPSPAFPSGRSYVQEQDAVRFPAVVGGRNVWCFVAGEAFPKKETPEGNSPKQSPEDLIRLFDDHEGRIHAAARRKIVASPTADEYVVNAGDF